MIKVEYQVYKSCLHIYGKSTEQFISLPWNLGAETLILDARSYVLNSYYNEKHHTFL